MDYSKHPKSIGEVRSDRTHDAKDWTPRDALIAALRRIDAGEIKPDTCFIAMGQVLPDGTVQTTFEAAGPNTYLTIGALESAKADYMMDHLDG